MRDFVPLNARKKMKSKTNLNLVHRHGINEIINKLSLLQYNLYKQWTTLCISWLHGTTYSSNDQNILHTSTGYLQFFLNVISNCICPSVFTLISFQSTLFVALDIYCVWQFVLSPETHSALTESVLIFVALQVFVASSCPIVLQNKQPSFVFVFF